MSIEENMVSLNQEEDVSGAMQDPVEENEELTEKETDVAEKANGSVANFATNNVIHDGSMSHGESHDQLQMIVQLNLQNEYLKSHIGDLKSQLIKSKEIVVQEREGGTAAATSGLENDLTEEIKRLKKEIEEQKQTQKAAENALEHLRSAYSEADGKVQELSMKLNEAQQKMEQEIKERDEKYMDLETKFGRLHKRAKQRIQELQKEKDDLEAHLNDLNAKVEQATAQQTLAQQELERARQQASDALKSMDVERQQLRTANSKLRDTFDEMRRSLEAKESTLEGLQQSVFEKDQMLEQVRGLLQVAEEKRQLATSELSLKHQKKIESLEAQLADALADRNKAAETIAALQMSLAEKDTKIAELDAASTGETVRLGATIEELRGEINHIKDQHDKERQNWEAACQSLSAKLEASENACLRSEIELVKLRSQLELELSTKSQLLNAKDSEILAAKAEISRLEGEFSAYKVRAHALLQKKEAELNEARNSELLKAHEEALKEAEKELAAAFAERDKALQDLHVALDNHDREIAKRDAALSDAEQQLRSLTMKLDSTTARYMSEKETWQKNLDSLEESWRSKCAFLEAQKVEHVKNDAEKELDMLKLQYQKLKEEHNSFRDIADRTIEEKEKEIDKLLEENRNLYHFLESRKHDDYNEKQNSASLKQDDQLLSIVAAEEQILLLAKQQAQREEELAQSQRHILALQEEIEELERENRLHSQQEAMLKEELRNMERSQKREGIDMTYLKNVVLKLLETGEVEALLPVVATLLQFSPEEVRKCQQVYRSSDGVLSPAGSYSDASSTPKSLFSRFPF